MAEIVFLLGRPGSGKSRTARYIAAAAARLAYRASGRFPREDQVVQHVTDYGFLRRMFLEDLAQQTAPRRFRPTCFDGFDVLDLGVLPQALRQVNAYIARRLHTESTLILVEFARQSYGYQEVWQYFRSDVLSRAFFLYLEADIETCMQRISKRARYQAFTDDQFVSPEIMFDYYGSTSNEAAGLKQYFGREHVATVENTGAWQETSQEIDYFLCTIPALLLSHQSRLPGLR
jgi:hypothetical protein